MMHFSDSRLLPFLPDETLPSYVSRMACDIGLSPAVFAYALGTQIHRINRGSVDALEKVASVFRLPMERVLWHSTQLIGRAQYRFGAEVVPVAALNRADFRVCPVCYREDMETGRGVLTVRPYQRRAWLLASVYTCPHHHVELVYDSTQTRADLTYDIPRRFARAARILHSADPVTAIPTPAETYLLTRAEHGPTGNTFIDTLSYHAVAKTCEVIGIAEMFGARQGWNDLTASQKRVAGGVGFDIVSGGANAIDRWLTTQTQRFFDSKAAWGLKLVYGRLYEWLSHDAQNDPALDPIRRIVHDHIVANLPVGKKDKIFKWPVVERKLHSTLTLALEHDLPIRAVRREGGKAGVFFDDPAITDDRLLMRVDDAEALAASIREMYRQQETIRCDQAWTKVHPTSLDIGALKPFGPPRPPRPPSNRLRNGLSMADVTRRLNLTRDHDRMLMDAGYLTPIPGSPPGQYAFDAKEVDALWTKLSARVITPTPKGLVPLSTAFLRAKCNSIQIIDFLYEGRLERVGQSDAEHRYAGLLVCPRELLPLVRGPELTGLTLKEVEAKLNTPSRVINDLIREKILATERQVNPVNRCEQTVVYADDLNYFMSVYVSAHRLALDWNFGPRGVTKRLRDYGIEPAFDRDLIRASFYRRSEIPPPEILGI